MRPSSDESAKALRRRQILDAAFAEFAVKGYAGASMAAIASRASASKETLYAWFENKESLFNTLLADRLAGINSRVAEVAEKDPSPSKVLPAIAEDVIRLMLAITPLSRAMGAGDSSDRALRLVGRTIQDERQRFADYLLRCRANGEIAFDEDPLELASLFVAMSEGEWSLRLGTGMVSELTDAMIRDHAQRVSRLFLKALSP